MGPFATPWRSGRASVQSPTQPVQRDFEIRPELAVVALDSADSANHHMVGTGKALGWHDLPRKRTEAALHAVADDGAADLPGHGKADAHRWIGILAVADQEDETGCRRALPAIR